MLKPSETPDLGKLKVDLGNLTNIIPTLTTEVYSLDVKDCGVGRKYPKISHMSVTTSKYWDLMAIEKVFPTTAYFEVTFYKKEGLLGVGIGNQIHRHTQMLGYQQNSFGVLSDGTVSITQSWVRKFHYQSDTCHSKCHLQKIKIILRFLTDVPQISYNHKRNAISVPGIKFSKNDVIGLGVMYDTFNQRRLFFTKNGQYVGKYLFD